MSSSRLGGAERVDAESLDAACAKLIGATGGPAGKAMVRRFQTAAAEHDVDLSRFWIVRRARTNRVLAAALLAPSSGGTGMLFTSDPSTAEESRSLREAIEAACAEPEGVRLAQSLAEPDQLSVRRCVSMCGFTHVGDLEYMKRRWAPPPPPPAAWPDGVRVRPWEDGDEPLALEAMRRSYIDTLDCPELCGLRDTEDVLASHRGAGRWTPELWWLAFDQDQPAGVLMLNEFPEQGHTELVYLGIGPELRGKGVGDGLLRLGLNALSGRRHRELTCAVDQRNAPARALYARHGFSGFSTRTAFVRPLPT